MFVALWFVTGYEEYEMIDADEVKILAASNNTQRLIDAAVGNYSSMGETRVIDMHGDPAIQCRITGETEWITYVIIQKAKVL